MNEKKKKELTFSDIIRVNMLFGLSGIMTWIEFHQYIERHMVTSLSLSGAVKLQNVLADIIDFDNSSFILRSGIIVVLVNICFIFALKKTLSKAVHNVFDRQNDLCVIVLETLRALSCCYYWIIADKQSIICLSILVFLIIISLVRFNFVYKSWRVTLLIISLTLLFSVYNWYNGYTLVSWGGIESSKNAVCVFVTTYSLYINILFILLIPCILLIEWGIAKRSNDLLLTK